MRPAPAPGLGVGDRGVGHRLLVLAAPGRQRVADAVQRLADAGDVAVAEDRPDALDEALALSVICTLSQRIIACAAVSRTVPPIGSLPGVLHATASRAAARALSQIAQSRA